LSPRGQGAKLSSVSDSVAIGQPVREDRAERLERRFEWPILVAALLVIPVIFLERDRVSHGWKTFGSVLNWLVWLAFAVEFVTMLAVHPRRAAWLRAHPLEAAVVVLTPPFLPAGLGALRLFRLLRLLRLGIFVKELRRLFTPDGVRFAAVVALAAAFGGGAIFADVEKNRTFGDGIWWAVTTMSTVGYGDFAPATVTGRIVAVCLMVIGIGFFALMTGAIAQRFLLVEVDELEAREEAHERREVAGREEVLAEIRSLSERLQQLEQSVSEMP
jgi:voltage-gated potassium channel